jgi:DNA-binding transcriptional ArsR family regulator
VQIITALAQEPASATVLASKFDMPLGNVSYHLSKVLFRDCDLVEIVKTIPRRGAIETVFGLRAEALIGAIEWLAIPEPLQSGARALALSNFQSAAVASLEAEGDKPKAASVYIYRPASVDRDGQRKIRAAVREFNEKVVAVEDRCAELDPTELLHLNIGAAVFETAPLRNDGRG